MLWRHRNVPNNSLICQNWFLIMDNVALQEIIVTNKLYYSKKCIEALSEVSD